MTYVPGIEPPASPSSAAPDVLPLWGDDTLRIMAYRCSGHPDHAAWQDQHRHRALILAGSGGFVYRTGRHTHLIEPGMAIVTRPGDSYQCHHPFGGGDESLVVVLPDPPAADDPGGAFLPSVAAASRLTTLARQPATDRAQVLQAVSALIQDRVPVPVLPDSDGDLWAGHTLLTQLTTTGQESPSLAQMAETVGLSRFGVNRLIRRLTGMTPHQYRIRQRLTAATHLLGTTDRSVTTIAADVGWEDLSTFLHAFRHHFGCSPGAFRRAAHFSPSRHP